MAAVGNLRDSESESDNNSANSGSDSEFEGFEGEEVQLLGNVLRYTSILNPDYDREVPKDVTLNWTDVDTPPTIAPFNRDVGLTVHLEEVASPLEFFQLLFDKDYWEKIVTQTNNYAAARINNEARPMTPQK